MITPYANIQQSSSSQIQQVRQTPDSALETVWQKNDAEGAFIKKIILQYLVNKSIHEAESKQVLTGVQITDLQNGKKLVSHNTNTQHFAASINKLPVVLLVLEDVRSGRLNMEQTMTWQASDVRAGYGTYDQPGAPLQAQLKDVVYDLLNRSGNTAVRVLVNGGLGGAAAVNERWAKEPQLNNTRLQPLDSNRFYLGNSTPADSLWTIQQLMKEQDAPASLMKQAMQTNIFTDVGTRSQLSGSDDIVLVNKVGILDDVDGNNRHDVGIIYNTHTQKSYGYSFFTTSPYDRPDATPAADQALKDMGRSTLRYAGDKKKTTQQPQMRIIQAPQAEQRVLY